MAKYIDGRYDNDHDPWYQDEDVLDLIPKPVQQAKQKPKNNTVKPKKKTTKKTTLKNKQSEIDRELHACKDKKISCRISEEMYNAIAELAKQFNLTFSSTVRYALSKNLAEFLGNIYFTTKEQEEKVIKYIQWLTGELRRIQSELQHIGVNVNQSTKELHILCKNMREMQAEIKTQMSTAKTANERMALAQAYSNLTLNLPTIESKINTLEQYQEQNLIAEKLEQLNKKVVKSLWRTVVLQEQQMEQTQ